MRQLRYIIYFIFALLFASCEVDHVDEVTGNDDGTPVEMILRFGAQSPISANATTRATLAHVSDESRIYNIYVFIFDSNGNKVLGRYFDNKTNLHTSEESLESSDDDGWYVHQPSGIDNDDTWGVVKFKTTKHSDATVFIIANIDSRMVNISAEKLGLVRKQSDIVNMVATLNHASVERTGYFPMTGSLQNVNTASVDTSKTLMLKRMDAKVQFWFKKSNVIQKLIIKNWKVVSAPQCSYIMSREERNKYGGNSGDADVSGYFETSYVPYDSSRLNGGNEEIGFSFYTLENALTPKSTPAGGWEYKHREEKDYKNPEAGWTYANDNSMYVVVNASVLMNTEYDFDGDGVPDVNNQDKNPVLNADVQYIIHLGNFEADLGNFDTMRNTVYTYTITIEGVEDIRVEVETSNDETPNIYDEPLPGATGDVTISLQEIFECDAHYEQCVIEFDQKYIRAEDVTWYVRTPFCAEGHNSPSYDINGTPITLGLDFKWVEFRLNEMSGNEYSKVMRPYRPHPTARKYQKGNSAGVPFDNPATGSFPDLESTGYVDELVEFLREQKKLCCYKSVGGTLTYDADASKANGCMFDENGIIRVTAFINEYYYERHPISGEWIDSDNSIWRRCINQDEPRIMNILSDTKISTDEESKIIGASYSIRQQSIQSIYNHRNPDLPNAWGVEHVDKSSGRYLYNKGSITGDGKNTSSTNGRYNTLHEWNLVDNSNSFVSGKMWSTYLNLEQEFSADVETLNNEYQMLRYGCMKLNRDNDGDGVIDQDEIRWYMAAVSQLTGLWMGNDGIAASAHLYNRSPLDQSTISYGGWKWRQHVISSTSDGTSSDPILIWAEEGTSTSKLSQANTWIWDKQEGNTTEAFAIRCARNVNMDDEEGYAIDAAPVEYIQLYYDNGNAFTDTSYPASDKVVFDLTYLDPRAFRLPVGTSDNPYEPKDLVFGDENSSMNRLYERFQVYRSNMTLPTDKSFDAVNNAITTPVDPTNPNPYCPEGYRLPNQRELTLMSIYAKSFIGANHLLTRTYYSRGVHGDQTDTNNGQRTGFGMVGSNGNMTVQPDPMSKSRCVRDLLPGEND